MNRANYIGAPAFFELNQACRVLVDAFGICVYLVGSSIERRDYRDVDVRCILDDATFDRIFQYVGGSYAMNPLWSVMCSSVSLWLSKQSGLPVDFQFQRCTQANAEYPGATKRQPLGVFYAPPEPRIDETSLAADPEPLL